MSSYMLCPYCGNYYRTYPGDEVEEHCAEGGVPDKAMIDYGSVRGHMDPYDDPLDVCPMFVREAGR